jgi:hypothetical protein
MPELLLFVEDSAQEKFLRAMLQRLAREAGLEVTIRVRTATGGVSKVLVQLSDFIAEVERNLASLPDGLVVAVDANCKGYTQRRRIAEDRAGKYKDLVVYAIPDPHIERWFLLDSEAFRVVLGRGCNAPDAKCEKQRYKRLLSRAVLDAGVQPLLGGIEYAEDLVAHYHFQRVSDNDSSFNKFLTEVRTWLNRFRL